MLDCCGSGAWGTSVVVGVGAPSCCEREVSGMTWVKREGGFQVILCRLGLLGVVVANVILDVKGKVDGESKLLPRVC